jgi:hypothetical protein
VLATREKVGSVACSRRRTWQRSREEVPLTSALRGSGMKEGRDEKAALPGQTRTLERNALGISTAESSNFSITSNSGVATH